MITSALYCALYINQTSYYQNRCDACDISLTTVTQSCVVLLFLHLKAIFNRGSPTCFRVWHRRQKKQLKRVTAWSTSVSFSNPPSCQCAIAQPVEPWDRQHDRVPENHRSASREQTSRCGTVHLNTTSNCLVKKRFSPRILRDFTADAGWENRVVYWKHLAM